MKDFNLNDYYSNRNNEDIGVILINDKTTYQKTSLSNTYHINIVNDIYLENNDEVSYTDESKYEIKFKHNEIKKMINRPFKIMIIDNRFDKNYYENLDYLIKIMSRYVNDDIINKNVRKTR